MKKFSKEFFTGNRRALISALPNSLIVISAHFALQESADLAFPFRQDSNFWYLTGINESDMVLVMDTKTNKSTLLLPTQNNYQKEWDGEIDTSLLQRDSGISNFAHIQELTVFLKQAKNSDQKICYLAPLRKKVQPYGFYSNPARKALELKIKKIEPAPIDIRLALARLRQIKQPVEILAIKQAIDITGKALEKAKDRLETFNSEKDLERFITAKMFEFGSDGHGYEPIVASGKNAAIIHYNKNDGKLNKNELVLLDVGAKVSGYSADISRAWIVGKSSERINALHAGVIQMQDKAFKMLKPGVMLREYQKAMELEAQKIMKKLNCSTAGQPFPHGFSHFLGLDLHDAGDYNMPLAENMVLTVEPGIYLHDEGLGIRVEDNIRITKDSIEVLSKNIPREI